MKSYDPYELMIVPPHRKTEMIIEEIKKPEANLNLVRDLITLGADVDWQEYTLKHFTGADVIVRVGLGKAALHWVVEYNCPEIARILIDAGADLDIRNEWGWTGLHWAAYLNRIQIAQMLLDAGADVNIQDEYGKTPYELAWTEEMKTILRNEDGTY